MRKFLLVLLLTPLVAVAEAGPSAANVILLANADDPGSLRVASHYAEVRGVPRANIIALPMPQTETISWTEFITTIWQPLQDELVRRKWIDAIPMELRDNVGRRKHAMSGHRIAFLITCRGVPLRIGHDPERYHPLPPVTDNPYFQTNQAAVDSELSLLAATESPINGFLANPLYGNGHPSTWQLGQVVRVSRLDGPTVEDALALPDRAIAAERTGLLGRAYVDIGGLRPEGDRWFETVAKQLNELDFETDIDRASTTFPATARFDAPVLYFGWYSANLNGPFALPGFQFPPGAIAIHLHSDSATTLRSDRNGWAGPFLARGVTATVGNVFEPYLQLLHRPDLLFKALQRGETFGDAACYALPALSWQSIAIGDPLYRPFATSFAEQWKKRASLPPSLAPYAVLRERHRLESARRTDAALDVLRESERQCPTLVGGYALARALEQAGQLQAAAKALTVASTITNFKTDEWALAHDAAQLLVRAGASAHAVRVYDHLLQDPMLPLELRQAWIGDARVAARAAGDEEKLNVWRDAGEVAPAQKK